MAVQDPPPLVAQVRATLHSRLVSEDQRKQVLCRLLAGLTDTALCPPLLDVAREAVESSAGAPCLAEVVLRAVRYCHPPALTAALCPEALATPLAPQRCTAPSLTFCGVALRHLPEEQAMKVRPLVLQLLLKMTPEDPRLPALLFLVAACPIVAATTPLVVRAVAWLGALPASAPPNLTDALARLIASRWETSDGGVDQAVLLHGLGKVVDQLRRPQTHPPHLSKVLTQVPAAQLPACLKLLAPLENSPEQLLMLGVNVLRSPAVPAMEPWMVGLVQGLSSTGQSAVLQALCFATAEGLLTQAALGPETFSAAMRTFELLLCGLRARADLFHRLLPQIRLLVQPSPGPSLHRRMLQKRLAKLCHALMHLHPGHPVLYAHAQSWLPPLSRPSDAELDAFLQERALPALSKEAITEAQRRALLLAQQAEEADPEPQLHAKRYPGVTGLQNLGQTCYMNAYLQALFTTEAFRAFVLHPSRFGVGQPPQEEADAAQRSPMEVDDSPPAPPPPAPPAPPPASSSALTSLTKSPCGSTHSELARLFSALLTSAHSWCAPTRLLATLPSPFQGGLQHDASEFGKFLFDRLEEELGLRKVTPNPLHSIFGGQTTTLTQCRQCGAVSRRPEGFSDLALPVPPEEPGEQAPHLLELIQDYLRPEDLVHPNQYHCDACRGKRDARRWVEITSPPAHLILTLSRFQYDVAARQRRKVGTALEYPLVMQLPLREECVEGPRYELYALVLHSGPSALNGHYYCVGRRPSAPGQSQWFLFNDATACPTDLGLYIGQARQRTSSDVPYILFYRLVDRPSLPRVEDLVSPRTLARVREEDQQRLAAQRGEWAQRKKKRQVVGLPPPPSNYPGDDPPFGDGPSPPWGMA